MQQDMQVKYCRVCQVSPYTMHEWLPQAENQEVQRSMYPLQQGARIACQMLLNLQGAALKYAPVRQSYMLAMRWATPALQVDFRDRWGHSACDEARRVGAAHVVSYLEPLMKLATKVRGSFRAGLCGQLRPSCM
jgi:hypothetical protein